MGVPRRRLSPPSSRSIAIVFTMFSKLSRTRPVATIPGRNHCANVKPGAGPTLAPSWPMTVEKIPSMITG